MIALWMLYSTVITAMAGLAAVAAEPFLRSRRLPLRWLWVAVVAASLTVTIAVAVRPAQAPIASTGGESRPRSEGPVSVPADASRPAVSGDAVLVSVWGAATFAAILAVLAALTQLARLQRRSTPVELDGDAIALTESVGPGAAPFGYPRILVPVWMTALEGRAVRLLMLHEREHVRTGDPQWLLAATLVVCVMPWNVALWWCVRRLRCAMEIDCDARVLSRDFDVQSYGELLLTVASRRTRPRLSALLTFAESSSPLERRIRTMTEHRSLRPMRAWLLGALAMAAIAAACEAPRPAPVAPLKVGTATSPDGAASANGDSARAALAAELMANVPAAVLQSSMSDPLLLIRDAGGRLLRASRLTGINEGTKMPFDAMGVDEELIQGVEIVKRGDWLPAEARGGVIVVTLKAQGTPSSVGDTAAAEKTKLRATTRTLPPDEARRPDAGASALVEIRDAEERLLYSKRVESASRMAPVGSPIADLPAAPDDIARVDVSKPPGIIRIWLKPGAKLREVK